MLVNNLNAVRDFIIAHVEGYTLENCDVENIVVFDNILMENPSSQKCAVIGFGGLNPTGQSSEFGGFLNQQTVVVNLFFMLWGTDEERHEQIIAGYQDADLILNAVIQDSTLGGAVMDASIMTISPPLTYNRSEMNQYLLIAMDVIIKENIYG